MPLTLHVGLSKKIGQPDYGSLGASCHVNVELDHALLASDLDGFQQRVRQAFSACRQAVQDELIRHTDNPSNDAVENAPAAANTNGQAGRSGHRASRKQLE